MTKAPEAMRTTVYGKWILAGEHAVLRGSPALVFPVLGKFLVFEYWPSESSVGTDRVAIPEGVTSAGEVASEATGEASVEFAGEHGNELRLLFWGVIEKALEMTGRSRAALRGRFRVTNSIPVGAGLGASAALCVGVGRWFAWRGWVVEADLPEFCRQLENLFHGESSGVDIAVALSGRGLHFVRGGERRELEPRWLPQWYISYSGKRGVTSECISRVKSLWLKDEALGRRIDGDMREAVEMAERALASDTSADGFEMLADAINKARTCFERWNLASGEIATHIHLLLDKGAYAVKPTGSGDGGYVLSLWRRSPPTELSQLLIPLGAAGRHND